MSVDNANTLTSHTAPENTINIKRIESTASDLEDYQLEGDHSPYYHQSATNADYIEETEQQDIEGQENKCCKKIDTRLVIYKAFYFLFYGAVGSLFPYLAVFYKQMWLSAHQVGILMGLRPFIQMCAAPLWGVLADKYNVSKVILLMSIGAWLVSNYSISLVKPGRRLSGCDLNMTYLPLPDYEEDQDYWTGVEIGSKRENITKKDKTPNDIEQLQNRSLTDSLPLITNLYDPKQSYSLYSLEKIRQNLTMFESFIGNSSNIETSILSLRKTKNSNISNLGISSLFQHGKNNSNLNNKRYNKALMNIMKIKQSNNASILKLMKIMRSMYTKKQIRNHVTRIENKGRKSNRTKRLSDEVNSVNVFSKSMQNRTQKSQQTTIASHSDLDAKHLDDRFLKTFPTLNLSGPVDSLSILPYQRLLAADELEEEFDSLNMEGGYPWPLDTVSDYENSQESKDWAKWNQAKNIYMVLLVITICGTILSSPAATLADTATLQALGEQKYRYGQQRLWGAFGWGLGAFVVGAAVSTIQEMQLCSDPKHVDYMLSFYVYAAMMALAFAFALFFHFEQRGEERPYTESFSDGITLFFDCQHACFILTLLCCGAAMGFIHTFLFWHLHDMGGTQFLFSIIAAIQCISEVIMYFLSGYLILKIGCDSVLYIGLLANVLRLFAYAIITQPMVSIPLEVLQGVSSASIWSAAVCYVGLIPGAQVTLQGLLHGIYWGLGHGGGGILGGVMVTYLGSSSAFIIYGIVCLVNLAILVTMKYWSKVMELIGNYTYVENIPAGTYILMNTQENIRTQVNQGRPLIPPDN